MLPDARVFYRTLKPVAADDADSGVCYGPMSVCLYVTRRCCIETVERIELIFRTEAIVRVSCIVSQGKLGYLPVKSYLQLCT